MRRYRISGRPLTGSAFNLAGGEAHDPVGADHLLSRMQTDMLIADKASYAYERTSRRPRQPATPW
jgi:hypothetical protein